MTRRYLLAIVLALLPSRAAAICLKAITPAARQPGHPSADAIVVAVPIAFTRTDYESNTPEQWAAIQGSLIQNAMDCYWRSVTEEIRKRGWKRV